MINIGDKLYQVNRDDRTSGIDEHKFIILECNGIFKLNTGDTIRHFGRLIADYDHRRIYNRMKKDGETTVTMVDHGRELIFSLRDNLSDVVADLKEKSHREYYLEKEDSRDELITLLSDNLSVIQQRKQELEENIEQISNTIKTLEEPYEDLDL